MKDCDYLTIILLAIVGYEMIANKARSAKLAIIISYPTSASRIIVLLKTSPKYEKKPTKIKVQTLKNHEYAYHICGAWHNGSY